MSLHVAAETVMDLPPWVELVPWAALITAVVALVVAFSRHVSAARNRRRDVYSEAYRTAMEWVEMVYRVRRRRPETEASIIAHAHDIQERIAYHEGWLASESVALRNSYCLFVDRVKAATGGLIAAAWDEPHRAVSAMTRPDDEHPDVTEASAEFLRDVRAHLSLLLVPRWVLWWRRRVEPWWAGRSTKTEDDTKGTG